jgi:DME family drug/metabolite transporter
MPHIRTSRAGLAQITATAVLWGTAGVVVAVVHATTTLTPASIGFYRLAVAAAALLAFAVAAGRTGSLLRVLRNDPLLVLLTGIGLGAYQALYFIAVADVGVSVATVVSLGLAPVIATAWEAVQQKERPGLRTAVTMVTALAGLVLITVAAAEPSRTAPHPVLGLLAAMGSGLGYAACTLVNRRLSQRSDALPLTTVTSAIGGLALLPLAAAGGLSFPIRSGTVGLLAYLGVVATAIAYALFYAGLRTVPGSAAAVVTLLEALTAALLAVTILGEPLPAATVVGGLLLLSAVAALYLRGPDVTGSGAEAPRAAPRRLPARRPVGGR